MAALILGYGSDPIFLELIERIAANGAAEYGYATQIGRSIKRPFGSISSGEVRVGDLQRTFSYMELDRTVGALGAAIEVGYTSGNSILVATATAEQIALLKRRRHDLYRGYAMLLRESVPLVSELGNALLITGKPEAKYACEDRLGDLAACTLRMVFSETIGKRTFIPKRRRHEIDVITNGTHDLEGLHD